ncbi:MAG: hypothetical protein KAH32_07960 [Chlamydiia bacterium]|nr:hypothetical protein [Chlamydiia bacterium]
MRKVSIDFDGTLDRADVEEYVSGLMGLGIEVHVLTSREPENGLDFIDNSDLFDVVNQMAIPKENVRFTAYEDKADWLADSGMLFHLDDQAAELTAIGKLTMVKPVNVNKPHWRSRCDIILGLNE